MGIHRKTSLEEQGGKSDCKNALVVFGDIHDDLK
jgi:hypothetical protein